MDNQAEKLVKQYHTCQVLGSLAPPEPMQRVEPPSGPWQDVAIYIMTTGENLLVIVDYYSRYFEVAIMNKVTTSAIVKVLNPIFARFGFPFSLKSDNGTVFVSAEFEEYLKDHGIIHYRSPPLFAPANGEVERQNRQLLKAMKASVIDGQKWQEELHKYLLMQRTTPHMSTGKTPAFLRSCKRTNLRLNHLGRTYVLTGS